MPDYHNTSSLSQPQPKKPEPVKKKVKGEAMVEKKGFFKQMAEDLIVTDGKTVAQTLKDNVILPTVKKLILDVVWNSITTTLYGRPGGSAPISTYSNPSYAPNYVAPNAYWGSQRQTSVSNPPPINTIKSMYESVYFYYKDDPDPTQAVARQNAQILLNEMLDRVKMCGKVSVAEMYTIAGIKVSNDNYLLDKWQWRDIDETNSFVVPHPSGGFSLDLPRPQFYPNPNI